MGAQVRQASFAFLLTDTLSSNGEGDEGNEGHEGHEEEDRERDCKGSHGQGNGAPRQQGEDRWWPDSKGPDAEQGWQDCEQEDKRQGQGQPLDDCCQEGTRCIEDQGLLRSQEGYTFVPESEGVHEVSALVEQTCHK